MAQPLCLSKILSIPKPLYKTQFFDHLLHAIQWLKYNTGQNRQSPRSHGVYSLVEKTGFTDHHVSAMLVNV